MAASDSLATEDEESVPQRTGTLEPFSGRFIPGICFESGHCVWLIEFTDTPTRFGSYTELWLILPDGERVLYTDPGEATEEVLKYHDFDRTVAAEIRHERQRGNVAVELEAADGTTLEVTATTGQTIGTRILNAVITLTPQSILQSSLGTTVSTASLNLLVDAKGMQSAGRTETNRRYRLDADRLERLTDGSATLNETELGSIEPPSRPIEFGEAKTTADALYIPGTIHLERYS